MTRYIVKRFLLMFPALLGVAVLVFVLLRVIPGDVVEMRFLTGGTNQFLDQKMLDEERAKLVSTGPSVGNSSTTSSGSFASTSACPCGRGPQSRRRSGSGSRFRSRSR